MQENQFVHTGSLPAEIVAAMDRTVTAGVGEVTVNPNKVIVVNCQFTIHFNEKAGETIAEFSEETHSRYKKRRVAIVRNHSLQLPGTQQLSEFRPDPQPQQVEQGHILRSA